MWNRWVTAHVLGTYSAVRDNKQTCSIYIRNKKIHLFYVQQYPQQLEFVSQKTHQRSRYHECCCKYKESSQAPPFPTVVTDLVTGKQRKRKLARQICFVFKICLSITGSFKRLESATKPVKCSYYFWEAFLWKESIWKKSSNICLQFISLLNWITKHEQMD